MQLCFVHFQCMSGVMWRTRFIRTSVEHLGMKFHWLFASDEGDHKHENAVELPIKEKIINGRDIAKLIHCKGIYLLIFQPIAAIPQQLAYKRNFATGHYWWCVDIYVPMIGPLQRPSLRSLLQRSAPPLNFVRCRRITIIN